MYSDSMDIEMVREVKEKLILHWNYRGFTELPEVIRNYGAHIQEVYLKWNQLSKLPSWISELSNITNLYLHGNQIEYLPDEIGTMRNLNTLDLGHNKLETIPRCIGQLTELQVLLLNENRLKNLPAEIGQLSCLEILSVSGNELVALPEWFGSLPRLKELNADRNQLMELPNRLTLAPQLSTISVCSNRLRYLPVNGFLSAPSIQFDYNPSLNYLSLPVSYQLIQSSNNFVDSRDFPAYGCFEDTSKRECNKYAESSISLMIDMTIENVKATRITKLPRQIFVARNVHENSVVSLWELALRQLYCNRFEHTMEINHFTLDVKVERTIKCVNNDSAELVKYMKTMIDNGPISICTRINCQQPIFTETWIVINSDLNSRVLYFSFFCSRKCLLSFIASNRKFQITWPWHVI